MLGHDADGGGGHTALEDGAEPAAQHDGQAGGEEGQTLAHGHCHGGTAENAHLAQHDEQRHKAVQALRAGQHLQDQALGGLVGILTDQTGGGLTHHTGTLSRADAAQARGQGRAQNCKTETADGFKKSTHDSFSSLMISTCFACNRRGR